MNRSSLRRTGAAGAALVALTWSKSSASVPKTELPLAIQIRPRQ